MAQKYMLLVILFTTAMACKTKHEETKSADSTTMQAPTADTAATQPLNHPTPQQSMDGWVSLFDGKTLNGWEIYKKKENDTWEVVGNDLHCKPNAVAKKRSDLRTTAEYENFELMFDFKIAPKANSGIMFRVTEQYDQPYGSGPEYQIIDDTGYPEKLKDVQLTAANYDMQIADPNKSLKPAGEWNTGLIIAKGKHIEHWLNGAKVLEYDINSPEWTKQKTASKWKEFPGYGMSPKGHIDLQDHGDEVWFRNIFIKQND